MFGGRGGQKNIGTKTHVCHQEQRRNALSTQASSGQVFHLDSRGGTNAGRGASQVLTLALPSVSPPDATKYSTLSRRETKRKREGFVYRHGDFRNSKRVQLAISQVCSANDGRHLRVQVGVSSVPQPHAEKALLLQRLRENWPARIKKFFLIRQRPGWSCSCPRPHQSNVVVATKGPRFYRTQATLRRLN